MAQEKYRFFDSGDDDVRSYDADEMAAAYRALSRDGVAALGTNLQVAAEGSTMRVLVGYGAALLRGYFYELKDDGGAAQAFTLSTTSGYDRIDRIVLRLSTSARTIVMAKKEGVASASPTAPSLTRSGGVYELSLAQVRVHDGATALVDADVTDERTDADLCGLIGPAAACGATLVMGGTDTRTILAAITAAQEAADAAQATANTGVANAAAAQSTANTAATNADAAQATANTAQTQLTTLTDLLGTSAFVQVLAASSRLSPAANNVASLVVTFAKAFGAAPQVVATVNSQVPHNLHVGVGSVSATGFILYLRNTSASAMTNQLVRWIAVGKKDTSGVSNDDIDGAVSPEE